MPSGANVGAIRNIVEIFFVIQIVGMCSVRFDVVKIECFFVRESVGQSVDVGTGFRKERVLVMDVCTGSGRVLGTAELTGVQCSCGKQG